MTITAEVVTEEGPGAGHPVLRVNGERRGELASFLSTLGYDEVDGRCKSTEIDWVDDETGTLLEQFDRELKSWEAKTR